MQDGLLGLYVLSMLDLLLLISHISTTACPAELQEGFYGNTFDNIELIRL